MKRRLAGLALAAVLVLVGVPVLAHGGDEEENLPAPLLARQALAYLQQADTYDVYRVRAKEKVEDALNAEDSGGIRYEPLEQAIAALRERRLDDARALIRSALPAPVDHEQVPFYDVPLEPRFGGTASEWALVVAGLVAVVAGGWIASEDRARSHVLGGVARDV